jgi:single-stranded-DNA-specific exonuclease
MLAACGVAFMTCVATNIALREKGYYTQTGLKEPPLKDWLDIVALGTVCDMVPLIGVNRLLVRTGFARMAARENAGIRALLEVGKVKGDPTPFHAGFTLGPRINAGSRVHQADLGAKLLATDDFEEATNIAWILNDCNDKRKGIQTEMVRHAVRMVEENGYADHPIIMVGHEDWHPGLAGLVAGQLKERFGKPSVVVTFAPGQGGIGLEGRGSGRSVAGINMGAAFIDARNEGILVKGGGHAMAAGFTILPDRIEDFRAFLLRHIGDQLNGMSVVSETMIDGILSVRGCRPDFVSLINNNLGPFGVGNDEPIFVLPSVKIHKVDVVGDTHVRCMVGDAEGGGWMKAMAFRAVDTPLGDALLRGAKGGHIHLAGRLKIDDWSGADKVEMHVTDAAPATLSLKGEGRREATG